MAPITSVIEVQYSMAIGTAHAIKQSNSKNLVVVTGGDAGTHEGDFATCLIWASRPENELPLLITVQNNDWGISTARTTQHARDIYKRAEAFGIKSFFIDGNDVKESYETLKKAMDEIRDKKKPVFIEAKVSRLYGHSSASGANYVENEVCPIKKFEKDLKDKKLITDQKIKDIWQNYREEAKKVQEEVMAETDPKGDSIWNHVYKDEEANWRKF